MFIITNERPKILGYVTGSRVVLKEKPLAYGLYRGRFGIETSSGVYILRECPNVVKVINGTEEYVLDFSPFRELCQNLNAKSR